MSDEARIVSLDASSSEPTGGKAEGLARLRALGFQVPPGFVIVGARPGRLPSSLISNWRALGGGPVAVRSSALDEDGEQASFAGQYETVLGVEGPTDLIRAVEACLESLGSARARAYQSRLTTPESTEGMCVVVQQMVEARAAGVCFTADPVSSRRDLLVVEAVEGLGERLVSGHASPEVAVFERGSARWRRTSEVDRKAVLNSEQLEQIAREALRAEAAFGQPLDLEWARDQTGALYWLQARPITSLGEDPRALDTPLPRASDVLTRCNVGEMMPGAVSPLTFSTCGRGIEVGWQDNSISLGVRRKRTAEQTYVPMFLGHLFINLSEGARFSAQVTGAHADQQSLAICGRIIPEVINPPPAAWRRRVLRIARQLCHTMASRRNIKRLEELAQRRIPLGRDAATAWAHIDAAMEDLYEAYALHLRVSTGAGAMAPVLLRLLAGAEREPAAVDHATLAELLAGARNVESADIVAGLERVADSVLGCPRARELFAVKSAEELHQWLDSADSGAIGMQFRDYLAKHGHRSVRELDIRQPEWSEQPLPVVKSLIQQVANRREGPERPRPVARKADVKTQHSRRLGYPVRSMVPLAHRAVRNRERAKSLLVGTTVQFKRAYRALAEQLVKEGRLPDEDAVFFLLHEELGRLAQGEDLAGRAVARRTAHAYQETLDFAEVVQGPPEPLGPRAQSAVTSASRVVGKPVSRGLVEGRARVLESLERAHEIVPGEILVTRVTDVGWTPLFGIISGLVTDLGSAVSHGAVVAREYGLPAVLNTLDGTRRIRTGDRLRLDGDLGFVEILETSAEPSN